MENTEKIKTVEEVIGVVAGEGFDEYQDILVAIKNKKPAIEIIKELSEGLAEGIKDYKEVSPTIDRVVNDIKAGSSTSEYKMMSFTGKALATIAILAPVIEGVLAYLGKTDQFGDSMVLSTIAVGLKAYLATKYDSSRNNLKRDAIAASVAGK